MNYLGALSQVADVATAYFTGAIAVHTFNSLVLHRRLPYWFCGLAVTFGWTAAILLGLLLSHKKYLYVIRLNNVRSDIAESF